jgi:hypothetical protein
VSNYRIVIRGVLPGHSAEQVAAALARFSKKSPEKLQALLMSGKDLLAKRTPDMQPALRYKQMLEKMGCACHINAEITERTNNDVSENIVTSLTNLTMSRPSGTAAPRDFKYQRAPLGVQLQELMRLLKPMTAITIFGSAVYYGWVHGLLR